MNTHDILARVAESADTEAMADPAAVRARGAQRSRRQVVAAVAGVAAVGLVVAVGVLVAGKTTDDAPPPPADGITGSLEGWEVGDSAALPGGGLVGFGKGSLWVTDGGDVFGHRPGGALYEVDPQDLSTRDELAGVVTGRATWAQAVAPVVTQGAVWLTSERGPGYLTRVDLGTSETTRAPTSSDRRSAPSGLAVTDDAVYVANRAGTVSVFDPVTGQRVAESSVAPRGRVSGLATDGTHLYVAAGPDLLVVDPSTRRVTATLRLGGALGPISLDAGRLYVSTGGDHLAVVDVSAPDRPRVVEASQIYPTIESSVFNLVSAYGYLWVIALDTEQLVQLDPDTLAVVGSLKVSTGREALIDASLTAGDGSVWLRSDGRLLQLRPQ